MAMEDGEVMAWLLATIPYYANQEIGGGYLPLHDAASRSPEAVIKALLAAYPNAAKAKNNNGKLPKDLARTDANKALLEKALRSNGPLA